MKERTKEGIKDGFKIFGLFLLVGVLAAVFFPVLAKISIIVMELLF